MAFLARMVWALLVGILGLCAFATVAEARPPLADPIALNIGINCQWQQRCQQQQRKAMRSASKFIAAKHPPLSKIHLCNKNARRGTARVDWVGFERCIRNKRLGAARR